MTSALETPELEELEDQTAFNLAVWEKLVADESLAGVPYRIETNRLGQIIATPPPSPERGEGQVDIAVLLTRLLPHGRVITECPISTSDGVKATDVVWISKERRRAQRGQVCLTHAPEICVEIISPSNSRREIREKRALYFEAGAEEVWVCLQDGLMEFFCKDTPADAVKSRHCPEFPARIEVDRD